MTDAGGPGHPDMFRAPGLVMLAVLCTLDGYAQLGTIGSTGWVVGRAGAAIFALGCLGAAAHLTRPARGLRRPQSAWLLLESCGGLVAATAAVVAGAGLLADRAVGAADLLIAVMCLVVATAGERSSVRHLRAGTHPSRFRHH